MEGHLEAKFEVKGCPIVDGVGLCAVRCSGGWAGTKISTEKLTKAVRSKKIYPERLGCQPLEERAREALRLLES
jgi:hypothetical protein